MPIVNDPLADALNRVKATCARASKPAMLADWMDFLQYADDRRFLGRPRDRLTAQDFSHYLDECGGRRPQNEIAWFLPRMCEVMAAGEPLRNVLGWDESFCFLAYSGFPDAWPDDRAAAMQDFAGELAARFVSVPEPFSDGGSGLALTLGTLVCGMARGGIEAQALTARLDACPPDHLERAVWRWLVNELDITQSQDGFRLRPDYWSGVPQSDILAAWFQRQTAAMADPDAG
ncbi:MAG: hypothetical protein AAF439_01915 [Pseudomonadota bacterium]